MDMKHYKNALSWFEIPTQDFDRAKKFYQSIFAFEMPEMNMGGMRMGILLHDRDAGGVGGAIVKGEWSQPSQAGTIVYLNGGEDLTVVLDRVGKVGGKVMVPKSPIEPDMGFFAVFQDSEGNSVGLFSPK
jgi:predicted enzyme related to lactoylglutathione lyase